MNTDKPTQQNIKVVVTGNVTEPVTDPARIVGVIEFSPERKLVVHTNDPALARRIMDGITVTIMGGEDVKRGEAVLFKRAYAEPGTERHFNFLGSCRHGCLLLQPFGLVVYSPLPHLIQVPLPSFSYRLEAEGHSAI